MVSRGITLLGFRGNRCGVSPCPADGRIVSALDDGETAMNPPGLRGFDHFLSVGFLTTGPKRSTTVLRWRRRGFK